MKRLISFALVLVMIAALFAGCGKTDQEKLVGVWKGEIDMTEAIKSEMGEDMDDLKLEKLLITVLFTFTEEGAYTLKLDEETVDTAIDSLLESMRSYLKEAMEKEAADAGVTAEDMLSVLGMTMEEFVDAMLDGVKEMDLGGVLNKSFKAQGKSLVEDGKIYISDSVDTDPDKSVYFSYTLEGDVLTLTERVGGKETEEGEMDMVFPMILKKTA